MLVYGITGLEEEYDSELTTYNAFGNNFRQFLDSIDVKGLIENIKMIKKVQEILIFQVILKLL